MARHQFAAVETGRAHAHEQLTVGRFRNRHFSFFENGAVRAGTNPE
jgi:hypothetical protein